MPLFSYFESAPRRTVEVLIVDDSSVESFARVRESLARISPPSNVAVRLLEGPRRGKGASIRKAVLEARGEVIFLIDSDLPVPLSFIEEFIQRIDAGADAVIAERSADRKFTTAFRWILSHGLRFLQRAFVFHSRRFRDTQCGFKAFRRSLARELARQQTIDGGMYDLEYLYIALQRGARVESVTIQPNAERGESRINAWRCLRHDPIDVARIKVHGVLGHYR